MLIHRHTHFIAFTYCTSTWHGTTDASNQENYLQCGATLPPLEGSTVLVTHKSTTKSLNHRCGQQWHKHLFTVHKISALLTVSVSWVSTGMGPVALAYIAMKTRHFTVWVQYGLIPGTKVCTREANPGLQLVQQNLMVYNVKGSRISWSIMSKAALRYRITWMQRVHESLFNIKSFSTLRRAVSVLCHIWKPDWNTSWRVCQ